MRWPWSKRRVRRFTIQLDHRQLHRRFRILLVDKAAAVSKAEQPPDGSAMHYHHCSECDVVYWCARDNCEPPSRARQAWCNKCKCKTLWVVSWSRYLDGHHSHTGLT